MEPQYYIPKLEDLFVGYELQFFDGMDDKKERWIDFRIDDATQFITMASHTIRTPYLTANQLQGDGWEKRDVDQPFAMLHFTKQIGGFEWYLVLREHQHDIGLYRSAVANMPVYSGYCPSINELRTILKLVNHK